VPIEIFCINDPRVLVVESGKAGLFYEALSIARAAVWGFLSDNALSRAAAIAFYAATSLAPVLLIVIAVAGIVVGRETAQLAVSLQLSDLVGDQGAELVATVVRGAANNGSGIFAASIAVLTLIVTASGVFGEMQAALNQIWKVDVANTTLSALVRARVASLGLVAALGFLLLVSLSASAAISGLSDFINAQLSFGAVILSIINTVVSLLLLTILFGAIYKVLPDRALSWRDVGFGAIVSAVLFTIGKTVIGIYLGTSAIASSYGAAGSLIVLLLWVFYSSATFLFGAEITRAFATSWGTQQHTGAALAEQPHVDAHSAPLARHEPSNSVTGPMAIAAISCVSAAAAVIASTLLRREPPKRCPRHRSLRPD
jgi:membrane protein